MTTEKNLGYKRFWDGLEKFSFLLLALYVMECTLGSSGRWLSVAGLSARMLLFGLCFVCTLPALIRHFRQATLNQHVAAAILFGADLLLMAVIGIKQGHNTAFVQADVTSFLSLALMPGFYAVVCNRRRADVLWDCLFWAALCMAVVTCALHYLLAFLPGSALNAVNEWINERSLGGLASLKTGMQRVYFKSQIFLQVALLLGIRKIGRTRGLRRACMCVCEGVLAFACILSYTRGFWMGLVASALLMILLMPRALGQTVKAVMCAAAVLCALMLISWAAYGAPVAAIEVVNRFDSDLIVWSGSETMTPPEPGEQPDNPPPAPPEHSPAMPMGDELAWQDEQAVQLRAQTLSRAYEQIAQNPVLGGGLGLNLDGIRVDGKIEYMYQDVLMKTGAVGLLLFAAVFFGPVVAYLFGQLKRKKWRLPQPFDWEAEGVMPYVAIAAYLGVALTSYVNPYLSNPMGIMLLLLTAATLRTTGHSEGKCVR